MNKLRAFQQLKLHENNLPYRPQNIAFISKQIPLPVMGSGLGFQPFLQVTSLQKGNRTEQEMEGPDAFSVPAQGILMQSVMKILVLQIVGLGWKPFKIQGPQLGIKETKRECKN